MVHVPEVGSTNEERRGSGTGVVSLVFHNESGFCCVPTCLCHEVGALIRMLGQAVQQGLASVDDANRIYHGRTV